MKIGLKEERWGDEQLVEKLLDMMQQTGADFTVTFRQLAEVGIRMYVRFSDVTYDSVVRRPTREGSKQ